MSNGCLWLRPGSHVEPVRRQMARNPEYFEADSAIRTQQDQQVAGSLWPPVGLCGAALATAASDGAVVKRLHG